MRAIRRYLRYRAFFDAWRRSVSRNPPDRPYIYHPRLSGNCAKLTKPPRASGLGRSPRRKTAEADGAPRTQAGPTNTSS